MATEDACELLAYAGVIGIVVVLEWLWLQVHR